MSKTTQAMKSHKNEPRSNRWKWMAGATAATAAGVTASQAYGITINLVDNYISVAGGNHLNADLTGDGHPDLTITGAYQHPYCCVYYAGANLNGVQAFAAYHSSGVNIQSKFAQVRLGSRTAYSRRRVNNSAGTIRTYGTPDPTLTGSIPIFFKDLHIKGGAPTEGFLKVTVSAHSYRSPSVRLDSLTYTPVQLSGRAVPDQGSSLTLLAMGAGGVLALRHRRKTSNN